MSPRIETFQRIAQSNSGIGFVKLKKKGAGTEAVQYGGSFCARTFGWYGKTSAQQNIAVRANLLQSLADSPENFSDRAVNAAARALGMQGDETLRIANSPLSKRDVLQIISQTRVYDRNEALGLNDVEEGEVPEDLLEQFRTVMTGGTAEEAERLARDLNSCRFSLADIQNRVSARLAQPDCAPFRNLASELADLCHGSYLTACAGLGHAGSAREMEAILLDKIEKKVAAKIAAGRMIETLSDPRQTAEPFSPEARNYLMERLDRDPFFNRPEYVRLLHSARNGAAALHGALENPNCTESELAEAFQRFFRAEQDGMKEMAGLVMGGNETMDMHQDVLHLSAIALNKPPAQFYKATAAAQEQFEKLLAGMDFLATQGEDLPGVELSLEGRKIYGALMQMEQLFCTEVDTKTCSRLEQVDEVTRTMARRFGCLIPDPEPFGAGEIRGEYSTRASDYILTELKDSIKKGLKRDFPDRPLEEALTSLYKDVRRGEGVTMGGRVINAAGTYNGVSSKDLTDSVREFFTRDGVLDRQAMVAVGSFLHQSLEGLLLVFIPKLGMSPLPDAVSTEGHHNDYALNRNEDGSYDISFRFDVDHIQRIGEPGMPGFIPLDGDDGGNTFSCSGRFRMAFRDGKPELSMHEPVRYSYNLEARRSPAEVQALNRRRFAENTTGEAVEECIRNFTEEHQLQELPELTEEERKNIVKEALGYMQSRTIEGILTGEKCRDCVKQAIDEVQAPKVAALNVRRCRAALDEGLFASVVDGELKARPEFAGMRDALTDVLEAAARKLLKNQTLKIYSLDDVRASSRKILDGIFVRKASCLRELEELPELSEPQRAWFRNLIQSNVSVQHVGHVRQLLDHREVFLPLYQQLADGNSSVSGIMSSICRCTAAAASLRKELLESEVPVSEDDLRDLNQQLADLSRVVYEDKTGHRMQVSERSRAAMLRTLADLQHVVYRHGMKNASERARGPVHASDAFFEDLQKDLANLGFFAEKLIEDMPAKIADTPDFARVSAETKMYLMDCGFSLDRYEGLAHGWKGTASREFVASLNRRINEQNLKVQGRQENFSQSLEKICRDAGRWGTGLVINGREVSKIREKTAEGEVVGAFRDLCKSGDDAEPDPVMARAFGSVLHQGLAGILMERLKNHAASPYRGTLLGAHETEFNVTGNMEEGFRVDYKIHVAADVQPGFDDRGNADSALKLKEGSGWGAEFSFTMKKTGDGKVEMAVLQPVDLEFMVAPAT